MPEEPTTDPDTTPPAGDVDAERSTDLVLPSRRAVAPARRRPDALVRARAQLIRLRENPAAMATLSAAATVGSALLTAGLRHALRQTSLVPARGTASVAVRGYIVHEVHVVHHVVHHVIGPPAD